MQLLTHSRKSSFQRCRKRDWFAYEWGIRPDIDAQPLRFGNAFHDCRELLNTKGLAAAIEYAVRVESLDAFDRAMLIPLIGEYARKWENCDLVFSFLTNEETFSVSIRNPETGAPSKTFVAAGKRDAIVKLRDGRRALFETKTTAYTVDDTYWRMLLMDGQLNHYILAAREQGIPFDTVVYDVVRKPGLRPLKATPEDRRKFKQDGTLYANQRELDETPDEYGKRIAAELEASPDTYLHRREIPRLDHDLDEYAQELWDVAKDLREAQNKGRWYRTANKFNCGNCAYFNLCSGLEPYDESMVPSGFMRLDPENLHPELKGE